MEKIEPSYNVGRNVNYYSYYGEQYGGSLKKLKIESLHDPAIPFLGICLEEMKIKTTMRYHLTPVRMATVKKTRNNKC